MQRRKTTPLPTMPHALESVLAFWLGQPAREPADLLAKFRRWYQGGEAVDVVVRNRFGAIVESALAGELDDWSVTPRGRLALVIVLDQLTRNMFRGTPRAYAGDRAALTFALEAIDSGSYYVYGLEERLFAVMPLVHAENLALQTRAVAMARAVAAAAPVALRPHWETGADRTAHYRSIIARFGRFPHRNAILGRASTPEEIAFLEEEARANSR